MVGDVRYLLGVNRTRIKMCGLKTQDAVMMAAAVGVDAIGFVFEPRSPRYVTVEQAAVLGRQLPAFVDRVGLFVDRPVGQIVDAVHRAGLSVVQLHGQETPDDVAALVHQLGQVRVMKALAFDPEAIASEIGQWQHLPLNLCGILFDTPPKPCKPPPNPAQQVGDEQSQTDAHVLTGGSGHAFDWQAFAQMQDQGLFDGLPPVILAGGLTIENVKHAIQITRPYAVDVSSGIESSRGVKDLAKMVAFAQAVKQADVANCVAS